METNTRDGNKEYLQNKVISAGQAAETSGEVDARHARAISLLVDKLDTAISGGTVKLEGAPYSNYPNDWLELASITVSNGKGLQAVNINENDDKMPIGIVRARISGAIANGTVDVYIISQG